MAFLSLSNHTASELARWLHLLSSQLAYTYSLLVCLAPLSGTVIFLRLGGVVCLVFSTDQYPFAKGTSLLRSKQLHPNLRFPRDLIFKHVLHNSPYLPWPPPHCLSSTIFFSPRFSSSDYLFHCSLSLTSLFLIVFVILSLPWRLLVWGSASLSFCLFLSSLYFPCIIFPALRPFFSLPIC